jgi:hypothetical protein
MARIQQSSDNITKAKQKQRNPPPPQKKTTKQTNKKTIKRNNINKTGNKTKFDLLYDNVYSKLFTISKCKCSGIATVCVSSCHEHLYVYVILVLNKKFQTKKTIKRNEK